MFPGREDIKVKMQPGMTFTIEPIISQLNSQGQLPRFRILSDGWTVHEIFMKIQPNS
jgi:methionine aminopeptidase